MSEDSFVLRRGDPPRAGTYIAYVDGEVPRWAKRMMLFWDGARWGYPLSDQKYRGPVHAWIGPLPAMKLTGSRT